MKPPFIITVDGPAASGTGTIANRLGALYRVPVLDSGLLYRAVGELTRRAGKDLD
ncbi:MAG: (d)CMP kinase, partial [Phenylobacterium sp.]|nr:(d)CMP kinase [Phenylobacterium sp.]